MTKRASSAFVKVTKSLIPEYLENQKVKQMEHYIQHGSTTTYQHCINVMAVSFIISKIFGILGFKIDMMVLLVGALLHDFYLYDWHDGRWRKEGLHCFSHPQVAKENAKKYFNIDAKTSNVIESHMFPATLKHPMKSKEALIVNMADKYCAIIENIMPKKSYAVVKMEV